MLRLNNISIKLGEFHLKDISLELEDGDYFVLLGKSGAGKTVLLEIVAGLINQNSGEIYLNNQNISNEKIQKRNVGIVFQDFSIFPHYTVKQNIAYSLKNKNLNTAEKESLIKEYASLVDVSHLLNRNVSKLSGGELQRVALARTLILKPQCLLLDEPLSSLDIQLKGDLRNLLRKINQAGTTILHVTHDYEEAIALSNKVAVLHDGEIIQQGFTKDVFSKPANEFVANFTGVKNFFLAHFNGDYATINNKIEIHVSNHEKIQNGKVIIRGEEIVLSNQQLESSASNNFKGTIKQIIPFLSNYEIIVDIGSIELSVLVSETSLHKHHFQENHQAWVSFKSTAVKIIT